MEHVLRKLAGNYPTILTAALLALLTAVSAKASPRPDPDRLQLASVNAAVAVVGSDNLLAGKNADRPVPIASVTKLMTALVVLESGQPLDEWLDFLPRHKEAPNNAYTRIRKGSELRRGDVLKIALMSSENFAAYTLARHFPGGYEAFVAKMNETARSLGMSQSRFVDPTGLSPANHASAADLVRLVNAALRHPEIGDYSTSRYFTATFRKPRYRLDFGNTNVLVHRGSWEVDLSKTGYLSEAGRCLVMVSPVEGQEVVMVLLDSFGTRSPVGDAGRIKRWLATGDSGKVAGAARAYEQRRNAGYGAGTVAGSGAN